MSGDLEKGWTRYLHELGEIKRICVPRYLFSTIEGAVTNVRLHGFCDASEQAYCAVIFVTTVESENEFASRIVTSKTKVAPIKKHSIPRLELLSSLLLTEACVLQSKIWFRLKKDFFGLIQRLHWHGSRVKVNNGNHGCRIVFKRSGKC